MAGLIGRTPGNYRVLARIGRGGMAVVYKAYQPALERYVAIDDPPRSQAGQRHIGCRQ